MLIKNVLTSVVYRVQMIPVENKDNHILSPVAEIRKKHINVFKHGCLLNLMNCQDVLHMSEGQ